MPRNQNQDEISEKELQTRVFSAPPSMYICGKMRLLLSIYRNALILNDGNFLAMISRQDVID
jgi:hypothetical protein